MIIHPNPKFIRNQDPAQDPIYPQADNLINEGSAECFFLNNVRTGADMQEKDDQGLKGLNEAGN